MGWNWRAMMWDFQTRNAQALANSHKSASLINGDTPCTK